MSRVAHGIAVWQVNAEVVVMAVVCSKKLALRATMLGSLGVTPCAFEVLGIAPWGFRLFRG